MTYAAVINAFYIFEPYVSPIYSTPFVPSWWTLSPAFLLLWIPSGFRLTCYYGRKAYYRSFFLDPVACSVEEPYRKNYCGETAFPFILQNLHRFFLYLALLLLGLHWYEWFSVLFFNNGFYLGVGTIILLLDTIALTLYVFSCHSLRHLIGGKQDCFSNLKTGQEKLSYHLWKNSSALNIFHNAWFWISLYTIGFADLYIRLLALKIIPFDPHFFLPIS